MTNPLLDAGRVAFLAARQDIGPQELPAWPRSKKVLKAVEVAVDWVRFSTLNHRTRAEQMQAIHRSGEPNLFKLDPLGKKAQDAQYKILKDQEGFDALKADLLERGQQDLAVITADGILINGNRRSAALKSLYEDDKVMDRRYVRCLVLPDDATPAELLDLEAELQVARDFKEDYSWVNEAMLIEELFEREGKDFGRVAHRMHRSESDVRSQYEKLQQLHQLVALSKGSRQYVDFINNESAFDELAKHVKNKPKPEADAVKSAYFLGTLTEVNYRRLRHLRRSDCGTFVDAEIQDNPALTDLVKTLREERTAAAGSDALDEALGMESAPTDMDLLISLMATKAPGDQIPVQGGSVTAAELAETIAGSINAAAKEAEEGSKDKSAVRAPTNRTIVAIEQLQRALDSLPRAKTFPDWNASEFGEKIAALEAVLVKLKNAK